MFRTCSSLISINFSNTFNVINDVFEGCKELTSLDIKNFNSEKINRTIYLKNIFKGCASLKIRNIEHDDFKIRS